MKHANHSQRLSSRIWNDRQRTFLIWLATPEDERDPKTQRELAATLQCDPATLSDWKKMPGFLDEVQSRVYDELKDAIPTVLHNIKRRAMYGDKRDFVDMFFSLLGGAGIVAGANATMSVATMTEDEALAILERTTTMRLTARVTEHTTDRAQHTESEDIKNNITE